MERNPEGIRAWCADERKRVLLLSATPRAQGNSQCLATAFAEGASQSNAQVRIVRLSEHISGFLRDCRSCRMNDGECAIADDHAWIFRELFLPADAIVYASPIWWYGISAQLKAFIDRMFCYVAQAYPDSGNVVEAISGKRAALLLSAEESNLSARLGITAQMSELCRYLRHDLVGVVTGIGNTRSEVSRDPADPLASARTLGIRLFDTKATDYRIDTDRPKSVWSAKPVEFPASWR
ncbi:MAG: flavodoxin family protein [Proteobacteria bacterium]|nr:MAG: flavodoxin family protein [Pseudomonadota bacterium]